MNPLLQAVSVCLVLLQCNALQENRTFFMINEQLHSYAFSCASGKLVALSADKKSVLIYNVEKQLPSPVSISLPLPGHLVQISADGKLVAVAHDSYITIVHKSFVGEHYITKTHHIAIFEASSIVILEGLVCVVSSTDLHYVNLLCLSIYSGKFRICDAEIDNGSLAFVNIVKKWVYAVKTDHYQFNVSGKCLNENKNTYNEINAQRLWFSYNGSRLFLDNGLTLHYYDLEAQGYFNSSYDPNHKYSYFSQSLKYPYVIAGIRSDLNATVFYYSWPDLKPIKSEPIPVPPQGEINGAEEVHICDRINTTYAIVRYSFSGNSTKIGLVTLLDPYLSASYEGI